MKVKLYDIIGVKSGMNHYLESFRDLLVDHNIDAKIKSNYPANGNQFFPYIFVKQPVKKVVLLLLAYFKYAIDILFILKKSDLAIISSYGDILDIPFLFISFFKKKVIVDIHEVVSLDNKSGLVFKMLNFFYAHTNCLAISHSKKTDAVLHSFNFKNQIIKVSLFNYKVDKTINIANIDEGIMDLIKNGKDYVLFFGNIRSSKGIFELLEALKYISDNNVILNYDIIIAGQDNDKIIQSYIANSNKMLYTHFIIKYINDDETNFLFENCKYVLVPYKDISQSAILEMAFAFKKPLIASTIPYFTRIFKFTPSFGYCINTDNTKDFVLGLTNIISDENSAYYRDADIRKFQKIDEFENFVSELKALI